MNWRDGTYIGKLPVGRPEVRCFDLRGLNATFTVCLIGGSVVGKVSNQWWVHCPSLELNNFPIIANDWESAQEVTEDLIRNILSEMLRDLVGNLPPSREAQIAANEAIRVLTITARDLLTTAGNKLEDAQLPPETIESLRRISDQIGDITVNAVLNLRGNHGQGND